MLHPGFFENGFPEVDISVSGGGEPVKIRAVVDTGFDGFLSLPYHVAFPIGLTLSGIGSGKLANGSEAPFLVCKGTVSLGKRSIEVVISVEPDCRVLIGNAFIKALNLTLRFDPEGKIVELIEKPI